MPARCIDCKGPFNRAVAEDKLRCPTCTKPDSSDEPKEKWKVDLKKKKVPKK